MSTFATVVVSIIGFIAFFYVNLYVGSYRMRRAAGEFLRAVNEHRYFDAHALLTNSFQGAVPKVSFEQFLAERGIASIRKITRSHGDFWIGVDNGGVKPVLIRADGIFVPVEIVMHRESMSWKVSSINVLVRLTPKSGEAAPVRGLDAANDGDISSVEVSVPLTYWTACLGSLRMLFYSSVGWVMSTVFPLAGIFMILYWFAHTGIPSIPDLFIAIAAIFLTPLYVGFLVFLQRRNDLARGPFTYRFDSKGFAMIKCQTPFSKPWTEINRVTESVGLMFVFVGPKLAHCLPINILREAGVLEMIREMVARNIKTDNK